MKQAPRRAFRCLPLESTGMKSAGLSPITGMRHLQGIYIPLGPSLLLPRRRIQPQLPFGQLLERPVSAPWA